LQSRTKRSNSPCRVASIRNVNQIQVNATVFTRVPGQYSPSWPDRIAELERQLARQAAVQATAQLVPDCWLNDGALAAHVTAQFLTPTNIVPWGHTA